MRNSALEKAAVRKVKSEIDSIIDDARCNLQSYVDDESDIAPLEDVTKSLTQIERTLQLVQINGAAVLAREMSDVVDGLINDSISQKEKAQEAISRGILQMSDYLEYVQAGHKDVPVVLLPLLNDLRGVREAPLLSEHILFFPNLDEIDVPDVKAEFGLPPQEYAKKIRYGFQIGLVGLIQNQDINNSATKICKVAIRLHQCSIELASRRLWWITSGVAQAVAIETLATSAGLASLLGQVDRQIKSFAETNEATFAKNIPISLIKNLLYYVGIAKDRGRIVNKIKNSYRLNELIPNDIALSEMRKNMSGPNVDVLDAVSKALYEDIASVKDSIELYVQSENRAPDNVHEVSQSLQKIADTLSMLGLEEPREEVMREVAALNGLSTEELEHADSCFVKIAETLIKAEGIVENFVTYRNKNKPDIQLVENSDNEASEDCVDEIQFKKIQAQTITETLAELEDAKDAISQVLTSPEDESALEDVQNCFRKIIGALLILKFNDVAAILENVQAYLIGGKASEELSTKPEKLEAFAESVTSVECYLESIISEEDNPKDIIRHGIESVSKLIGSELAHFDENGVVQTIEVDELIDDKPEAQAVSEEANVGKKNIDLNKEIGLEELSATTLGLSIDKEAFAEITGESLQPTSNTCEPNELDSDENNNTPPLEAEPIAELNKNLPVEENSISVTSNLPEPELIDVPDAELEINSFFCEADDDVTALELNNVVQAETDHVDVELKETSLLDLNEIDHEQSSDLKSINLADVEEEVKLDSTSSKNIEEVNLSSEDANDIQQISDGPSHGEDLIELDHEAASYKIAISENGIEKELHVLKHSADKDVIEIFIEEAEEEIEKISHNLSAWHANLQNEEALITARRSFHTLKGSGRLIGAEIMGEFSWYFENILNKVIENSIQVTPELHEILNQSIEGLQQLLAQLKFGEIPTTDIQALIVSAQQFCKSKDKEINDADNNDLEIKVEPNNESADDVVEVDNSSEKLAIQIKEIEDCIANTNNKKVENPVSENKEDFDAELKAIFAKEAKQHIQALEKIIHAHESEKIITVDNSITHALHTLYGSARTAGVDAIVKICGPLDEFCSECRQQNKKIQGQQYEIIAACVDNFNLVISKIEQNVNPIEIDAELLKQVDSLKFVEIPVLEEVIFKAEDEQESELEKTQFLKLEDSTIFSKSELESADLYEDKDEDLSEIFLEEASDILSTCNKCLESWQQDNKDENSFSEFRRQLHTLKGSARMAAYTNIGDFSHAIESLVIPITEGLIEPTDNIFTLLQRCLDALHEMAEDAIAKRPVFPAANLVAEIERARGEDESPDDVYAINDQASTEPAKTETNEEDVIKEAKPVVKIPVLRTVVSHEKQASGQPVVAPQQAIRLQADLLDNLVNNAGEVNIFQARLEQTSSKYISSINELEQIVDRLREQLRNLEIETETQILSRHAHESSNLDDFDPLELDRYSNIQQLSRSLAESVNDLLSIKEILYDQVRESEMLLLQQHRISSDLQQGLMRTRMVHFNQLVPRMQRIVRQTARELDKDADLKVYGAETEVDSSILNRLVAPLEHLIRNAISHGIEDKDQRALTDKSKNGEITISVMREGTEIVIEVADDGAGIDPEKVKSKALDLGLIENSNMSERELLNLIMTPGFSTAGKVTQVSGRGVGMDVVANELKQIGGSLQIDSEPGKGARFTARIPFTLAMAQALLVKCGDEVYAVPLSSVEGVVRLSTHELKQKYEDHNASYHYADKDYRLCHLGTLLDVCSPQLDGADILFPVLLVRSGDSRLAIHVEATLGNREIAVKPLASQLSRLPAVSGATILGDGSVVLILDIQGLIRLDAIEQMENADKTKESTAKNEFPTILVVDDSITIRKVTKRFLERNDYKVKTARDGVDAVQQLQDFTPELILLDIEMPRMDGYELAMHVRNNARLKDVPIIMITSRTGEKHRQRALDIGVQHYLGKPYNEGELLHHIKTVM